MKDQNPRHYYPWPTPPILLLLPLKTPGTCVLSGESAKMTREHWRTKLRRRQNRRRQPPFKLVRASMRGRETASIAAGAPRGDAHIQTVVFHSNDSRNWQAPKRRGRAAAAKPPVRPPRSPRRDEGIPRLGAAAAATSYANLRAPFTPIRHSNRASGRFEGPKF